MHVDREIIKKSWKEFMKGTLEIVETFQGPFNLDSVVQGSNSQNEGESIILVHLLKKGNTELRLKLTYVKLG